MPKISTLFFVVDDAECENEGIFGLDDYDGGADTALKEVLRYLDRLELEVDQRTLDRLLGALSGQWECPRAKTKAALNQ